MLTSTLTVCQRAAQFNLAPAGKAGRPGARQWRSYKQRAKSPAGTFTLRLVSSGAPGAHIVRGFCGATYYKARGQGLTHGQALKAATYYTRGGSVWLLQLHGPMGKQQWQFASRHFARLFANVVAGQPLQWARRNKAPRAPRGQGARSNKRAA